MAEYMTDREYFGGQSAKDSLVFSYNAYWKHRNYLPGNSTREYSVTSYPPAIQFYASLLP